jgi:hypothetical protein
MLLKQETSTVEKSVHEDIFDLKQVYTVFLIFIVIIETNLSLFLYRFCAFHTL